MATAARSHRNPQCPTPCPNTPNGTILSPELVLIGHALDAVLADHSDRREIAEGVAQRPSVLAEQLAAERYGGSRAAKWKAADNLVGKFEAESLTP